LLSLIKGVLFQPSQTFREIEEEAGLGQAVAIVVLTGVAFALPVLAARQGPRPMPAGIAMLVAFWVAWFLVAWLLFCLVGHFIVVRFLKGQGPFRVTATASGCAAAILFLSRILDTVLIRVGLAQTPFPIFIVAWFMVILVIAMREVHNVRTLASVVATVPAIIVTLFLGMHLSMGRLFVLPHLWPVPWQPPKAMTWKEAPPNAENLIRNPGFEESEETGKDASGARDWRRVYLSLPLGRTELARDTGVAHSGKASARVSREGAPMGYPMLNAWVQEFEGLRPAEWLYVSLWMKTENATAATALLVLAGEPDDRKRRSLSVNTTPLIGTRSWTERRFRIRAPDWPAKGALLVQLWGAGRLWVDDVAVLQAAKAPQAAEANAPEAAESERVQPKETRRALRDTYPEKPYTRDEPPE